MSRVWALVIDSRSLPDDFTVCQRVMVAPQGDGLFEVTTTEGSAVWMFADDVKSLLRPHRVVGGGYEKVMHE